MPTANRKLLDLSLRRAVDIRRYTAKEVKEILSLLRAADRDFVDELRDRLDRLGSTTDFASRRYLAMLDEVRGLRASILGDIQKRTAGQLEELAVTEGLAELQALKKVIPIQVDFAAVPEPALKAIVRVEPFRGNKLEDWFDDLTGADQKRLRRSIQLGLVEGEGVPAIVKRVAGTRAADFKDGDLAVTRREAESIVRTGVNHVSNSAREEVWDANADIISGFRWVSTLDGRTTPICQARDGKFAPVGDKPVPEGEEELSPPGARPPAHVGCLTGDCLVLPCGDISKVFERPYDGEIIVIRTASGNEFTCTPNHPILTENGWVQAQFLERGRCVIRYLGSQNPLSGVDDESQNRPTLIEKIAAAFFKSGQVDCVLTSRHDFHGDAAEGEICVVGTHRSLQLVGGQTPFSHHGSESGLQRGTRIHSPLASQGTSTALLEADLTTSRGQVRSRCLSSSLNRGSCLPDPFVSFAASASLLRICPGGSSSFGSASQSNSSFQKDSSNNVSRELAVSREIWDVLAGKVTFDEIVYIGRRNFSGHVFNLETSSGIYFVTAGSIITHNCRSTMVAVLDGMGIVGDRPFVQDARRPQERTADFRAEARETGQTVKEVREAWAKEHIGQVPAKVTYEEWLRDQPAEFQDEVLGKARGDLFRGEKLHLDQFVDRAGNELTLDQIKERHL